MDIITALEILAAVCAAGIVISWVIVKTLGGPKQ